MEIREILDNLHFKILLVLLNVFRIATSKPLVTKTTSHSTSQSDRSLPDFMAKLTGRNMINIDEAFTLNPLTAGAEYIRVFIFY